MAYSKFDDDYKIAINNILKNIYGDTEYWGVGPAGNRGIIKPITELDDPSWSNYNFINSHWTVKDSIVIPYLKEFADFSIEKDKDYKESEDNTKFFKLLWRERNKLFGPESGLKDSIIAAINKTRRSGTNRESFVKLSLESIPSIKVDMIAQAGGTEDFRGIDLRIHSEGDILPNNSTAQVKPFKNITKNEDSWFVETDALRREYTTDLMVFGKQSGQEYHVAVFLNKPKEFTIEENQVVIPKNLLKILINYNTITKKSNFKSY